MLPAFRAAALLGAALFIAPTLLSAQVLPIPEARDMSGDLARNVAEVREELEAVLSDIGGQSVGRAPEAVASYYGVEARFTPRGASAAEGRDALAERFLEGVPGIAFRPAEISDLVTAGRLASSFVIVPRDPATPGPVVMDHVLWRRVGGRWEIAEHHAFGGTAEPGQLSTPGSAYAAELPGRLAPVARFTLAPRFGFMGFDSRIPHDGMATAGVTGGVEFGRAFELRGGYWQRLSNGERTQLQSGISGEARIYLLPSLRLRPFLSAGATSARYDGAGGYGTLRDEGMIPTAGGGIAIDLHRHLAVALNGTTHFFLDPARGAGDYWTENRTAGSVLFSAEIALTMPGPTPRRTVRRSPLALEYEAGLYPHVDRELRAVFAGIDAGEAYAVASRQSPTATLLTPDGMLRRGSAQISETLLDLYRDRAGLRFAIDDFGAAGSLAYARGDVTAADGRTDRAFFALVREEGEWRIRQTVIVPGEMD